jgi:hypothetical protein
VYPCAAFPCRNGGICVSDTSQAKNYKCVCPPAFYGGNCQYNVDECSLPKSYTAAGGVYDVPDSYTNRNIYPCGTNDRSVCTDMVGQLDAMWCTNEANCNQYFANDKQCLDCAQNQDLYVAIKGEGYRCSCENHKSNQMDVETPNGITPRAGMAGNGYRTTDTALQPALTPIMLELGGLAADATPTGCTDVDDCASTPCQHGGTCTDLGFFSYSCECTRGWTGTDCEQDVEECTDGTHTCVDAFKREEVCGDASASTRDCQKRLSIEGRSEHTWVSKADGTSITALSIPYGACIEKAGSYGCRCQTGWEGDGFTTAAAGWPETVSGTGCTDIPNCERTPGICKHGGTCSEPPELIATNDVHCDCPLGWNGLDATHPTPNADYCEKDDNECEIGPSRHNCDLISATCTNTDGSYTCACNEGWTGTGITCIDADDCEFSPCANGGTCSDIGTLMFDCVCVPGWRGPKCEDDWNECTMGVHACHNDASCINNDGSYTCKCDPGYSGDGFGVCDDVDDCFLYKADDPNIITTVSVCVHGTCEDRGANYFVCTCDVGYTDSNCDRDTNECNLINGDNKCNVNAECVNTDGSYQCVCNTGYTGEGSGQNCAPIADCDANPCDQDNTAACEEEELGGVPGLYSCKCKTGYTDTKCSADINECSAHNAGMNECDDNAICENTDGSYICKCEDGYAGVDGKKTEFGGSGCTDIDDCASGPCDHVPDDGGCENLLHNMFRCNCEDGYTDTLCDFDINECFLKTHNCDPVAKCVNTPGAYRCRCVSGYEGDGYARDHVHTDYTARDMFLERGDAGDDDRKNLLMTRDNKEKREHVGADELIGTKAFGCLDLDDCASQPCDPPQNGARGTCEDKGPNEFFCNCITGWHGTLCTVDINECSEENKATNDCDTRDQDFVGAAPQGDRSICTNSQGSHSCACSQGYYDIEATIGSTDNLPGATCNLCTQCPVGYKEERACQPLDRTCVNVDECTEQNGSLNNCDIKASCDDTDGSFTCECNGGFYGDGIQCVACTECVTGEHQVKECTSTQNRVCALHVPNGLYTVSSEAGAADAPSECLAFVSMAASDQADYKYPSRRSWGNGGEFCGYNSGDSPDCADATPKECLLSERVAVFYFHHLSGYQYTISSQVGGEWKCLSFGETTADDYPSRDSQLTGPLCKDGIHTAPRAIWKVEPIKRDEKKFMLMATKVGWEARDVKYECMAFMSQGTNVNPSLHNWGQTETFCGMTAFGEDGLATHSGAADQLAANKEAVWILDELSGPPPMTA